MRIRQILPVALIALMGLVYAGCDEVTSEADNFESLSNRNPALVADDVIPGEYIVVLRDDARGVPDVAAAVARQHGGTVSSVWQRTLRGFALHNVSEQAARAIARNPNVAWVEPNRVISLVQPSIEAAPGAAAQTTPWGVLRVGGFTDASSSTRRAFVIDTGVDVDHPDLNFDPTCSANFVKRGKSSFDDGNGHGTHVAGTIGAKNDASGVVGVAAGIRICSVRVLDNSGSGTWEWIINGVEHVDATGASGDVANMSLGGTASGKEPNAVETAILNAASGGIKFAIAAGNSGADSKNYTPARIGDNSNNVYTVSAIGQNNCLASWSNYGLPVDNAAPGVSILSTKRGGGTTTMSGTSMASPHVAGLLLLGNVGSDGSACGDRDTEPDPIAHK